MHVFEQIAFHEYVCFINSWYSHNTFNFSVICISNLSSRSFCSLLIFCVSARPKWPESHISIFLETKVKFRTASKQRRRGEGLKRYLRGVAGPFAMRQGQGLDTKPSLRGEERLCLEPEETRQNLLNSGRCQDFLDQKERRGERVLTCKRLSTLISNLFINLSHPTDQ